MRIPDPYRKTPRVVKKKKKKVEQVRRPNAAPPLLAAGMLSRNPRVLLIILVVMLVLGAALMNRSEPRKLTEAFEGTIGDITQTMVNSGYARKSEHEADRAAITIMKRIGYDPTALKDMLQEMARRQGDDTRGFGSTHPAPGDRIAEIEPLLAGGDAVQSPPRRQARFEAAMTGV